MTSAGVRSLLTMYTLFSCIANAADKLNDFFKRRKKDRAAKLRRVK
jgi:hypothetical protein